MATPVLVTVHLAQSLDGRLAIEGQATPLSTPEGRRSAHAARAEHDAVLVGANTVRIDDPQLTVRHVTGPDPLRVVLASRLDVSPRARVLDRRGRVLVIGASGRATEGAREALASAGADVAIVDPTPGGLVSLHAALAALAARGVKKLLVEGGARVLTSFFEARLVSRVEIEIAMRFLGAPGTLALGALGVTTLDRAPALANVSVERLGSSILVRGDVVSP